MEHEFSSLVYVGKLVNYRRQRMIFKISSRMNGRNLCWCINIQTSIDGQKIQIFILLCAPKEER